MDESQSLDKLFLNIYLKALLQCQIHFHLLHLQFQKLAQPFLHFQLLY